MSCKICWDDGQSGQLITPCQCKGTMQFVHMECLLLWIAAKRDTTCDICHVSLRQFVEDAVINDLVSQRIIRLQAHEKLPLTLQCALFSMWLYTILVLLLPFYYTSLGGSLNLT